LKHEVFSFLGVISQMGKGKYSGLPSIIGRSKKAIFGFQKDRLWIHINHWSRKHLANAGKEILIKSCAKVIPSYCMSVFLLPTTLEDQFHKMMNYF